MDVTEATFGEDVVARSAEAPVVVDFWAEWCGPCHALAPVLDAAVEARDGAVSLVKVDVDANPALSRSLRSTLAMSRVLYDSSSKQCLRSPRTTANASGR